ncbi:MAG: cyclic nucleotide-binding domain-containing protein [Cyanobacteria bacterium J06607_6]
MADTLLQELSNADLDWLISTGERSRLASGQPLRSAQLNADLIYVLIEGKLGLSFGIDGSAVSTSESLIDELSQGEVVGIGALFDLTEMTSVSALEPSLVMALPVAKVQQKLREDIAFAAHFYRAIAVILSSRLRRIFEQPNRIQFWGDRSTKEVLSIFGELRDSDVDWLASFGHTAAIAANQVVLRAARPVDALYIVLDGQMCISAPQRGRFNPLVLCFGEADDNGRDQPAFTTISKGGMPGIISFLDFRPLPVTIRTLKDSLVFAVPRQKLVTKLQVDDSFASRFYRVIAIEVLELLQAVSSQLVHPAAVNQAADDERLDEELDMADLEQLSDGAKKFNWMLSQLGVT